MLRFATTIGIVFSLISATSAADVDYLRDVKPLLAEKCVSCHGPLKQEAGLRLDAAHLIRKGSDSGLVAIADDVAASPILRKISSSSAEERMPPEGEGAPLKADQIAALKTWIAAGMTGPAEEPVLSDPKDHWAYQPVVRPQIPTVEGNKSSNPIDAFLASRRKEAGLTPLNRADSPTLLRRLSLDLMGLPPSVGELQSFVADDSETAYEREVDRMLAAPQYGERWARHWMDVWRYSDWDGFKEELRGSQRHIWRWRDWIVDSLNADKGYDRMVVEMIAGDELAPTDADVLPATGFLARNYHSRNRDIWLDAAVEHTAKAFLGMTLNCARCHDHKFDPIAQPEYYAFRAIFEPYQVRTDPIAGTADIKQDGLSRVYDADLDAKTYLYISGNEKQPDKEHPLAPAVPAVVDLPLEIKPVSLPFEVYFPALTPQRERDELAQVERTVNAARKKLKKLVESEADAEESRSAQLRAKLALGVAESHLESLQARWAADKGKNRMGEQPPTAESLEQLARTAAAAQRRHELAQAKLDRFNKKALLAAAESNKATGAKARPARIAKARKALETAEMKLVEARQAILKDDATYSPIGEEFPHTSTGRRLALAQWITDSDNPLTARVAVNHVWMRHFGEPLVPEVFDFGLRSPRPVHAELLDWLAAELVESGWSMKHLHRLIVTSQAYQMASAGDVATETANRRIDPDNRLFWRANVQRLDAEVIRDSLLYIAGKLDLSRGGPEIDYHQGENVPRRSLYFGHAYEKQMTMLVTFDAPSPTECYRRSPSIIPQQALALANSALSVSLARELAGTLWKNIGDAEDGRGSFVQEAFLTVLARQPTPQESELCAEFLPNQADRLADSAALSLFGGTVKANVAPAADPQQRARENLVHVLMNHNDFVTVR